MCGIAGFAGRGDQTILENMTSALAHRGPDGHGYFVDEQRRVFLGHRRLSILDISGGHQPMWNETGDVGIVYNGEIYNHAELRKELVAAGHIFKSSHSDTEVLVHGYEEWGDALPGRLNGMFAFAIYDQVKEQVFIARDRFGEKPLYYASGGSFFGFASEITALCEHPGVSRQINRRALQKLFAWGYLPAPHALIEGCHKLPGGHFARVDLKTFEIKVRPYWAFELMPDDAMGDADEDRLADELRHLVFQATKRRLISDVPIGLFLSGGLDSSSVLAGACDAMAGEKPQTFCVGFNEASFDESGFARTVADAFGSDHHEQTLDFGLARSEIPNVLSRLDEPIGDASILPTYLLCRFTRRHVTVALSGDGGDELLAGYDPFKALGPAGVYDKAVPAFLHRKIRKLADLLPVSQANMSFDFKLRRTLRGLSYPQGAWIPAWMSPLEPDEIRDIFEAPLSAQELYAEAIELWERRPDANLIDRSLEFFTRFYLQDDILTKVDRASMMVSLETRAIFLDNDLVDFCQKLPHRFKFRNGSGKYLLKKAMADILPNDIVSRPKKGLGIPLMQWLKELPALQAASELPGLKTALVDAAWHEHRTGKADHRLALWQWLAVQHGLTRPEMVASSE